MPGIITSMSNVSSTRPVGPAPPPPRKPWYRRRPTLSAIAAALGVSATLWATLVGQTVPDLLRDEDARNRAFRARVNSTCAKRLSTIEKTITTHVDETELTYDDIVAFRRAAGELSVAMADVEAPPLYEHEYAAMRASLTRAEEIWIRADAAFSSKPERPGTGAGDAVLAAAVAAARMRLDNCASAMTTGGIAVRFCEAVRTHVDPQIRRGLCRSV
jgi:hypothetical protein